MPHRFARKRTAMTTKTIKVNYLARVEGEGGLRVVVRNGVVTKAELSIFEPPRFFEAFLRGRAFSEAPDITARICGICPVAYQMSAVHAMEDALGVRVTGALRALRRLLYCGEWIESHALHIYLLHAPDFLGYAGAIDMAREHRALVETGLGLKQAGNAILTLLGGREVHPINVRVGGFYRAPRRRWRRCAGPPASISRNAATIIISWRCVTRRNIRSTRAASSRAVASIFPPPNSRIHSRKTMSNARPRCMPISRPMGVPISSGRSRATA
jgi:hypothetical protein